MADTTRGCGGTGSRVGARRRSCSVLAALVLAGWTSLAQALTFTPTDPEWSTWPEYCKARYVVSAAGRVSKFRSAIAPQAVGKWEARFGRTAWNSLHHYCAGIVFIARARMEPSPREHDFALKRAISEFRYSIDRTPSTDAFFPTIATSMAQAHRKLGNAKNAVEFADLALSASPKHAPAWSLKALVLRDHDEFDKAREVLVAGNDRTEGRSAEIHYFLGLVYIDLEDFDNAVKHARLAYSLGYPLPGLRNKLARLGHWQD